MAPKTLDGSAFSFKTTRGHTTHISILWVFVLFTFLAVGVVSLGGQQKGLVERQFPDTKVNGDLDVTNGILSKTGLVGPNDLQTTPRSEAFTAVNNNFHLLTGGVATYVVTLPTPEQGNTIKFLLTEDIPTGQNIDFTSPTVLALGSVLASQGPTQSTTNCSLGGIAANGTTHVTLRILGITNEGGGTGTTVECYAVKQGDDIKWLIKGFSKCRDAATGPDDSSFEA